MEKTLGEIKKHLTNLPDRCQLIDEYAGELLDDDENAESCLMDVYNGDLGVICLILSSNCAPFLFLFEDQPNMIDSVSELFDALAFAMFSADEFQDLDNEEKEEVKEEAKQILDKSLSILQGGQNE